MSIGRKINKGIRRIGNKFDRGAHNLGRKAHNVLNRADDGIKKVDTVLRKADHTLQRGHELGVGRIPYVGAVAEAAGGIVHGARQVSKSAKDISGQARKHANDLEKFNTRKLAQELVSDTAHDVFV